MIVWLFETYLELEAGDQSPGTAYQIKDNQISDKYHCSHCLPTVSVLSVQWATIWGKSCFLGLNENRAFTLSTEKLIVVTIVVEINFVYCFLLLRSRNCIYDENPCGKAEVMITYRKYQNAKFFLNFYFLFIVQFCSFHWFLLIYGSIISDY